MHKCCDVAGVVVEAQRETMRRAQLSSYCWTRKSGPAFHPTTQARCVCQDFLSSSKRVVRWLD